MGELVTFAARRRRCRCHLLRLSAHKADIAVIFLGAANFDDMIKHLVEVVGFLSFSSKLAALQLRMISAPPLRCMVSSAGSTKFN
jgi:hypothetical protein